MTQIWMQPVKLKVNPPKNRLDGFEVYLDIYM